MTAVALLSSFKKTVMHECSSRALAKLISCFHGTGDMAGFNESVQNENDDAIQTSD